MAKLSAIERLKKLQLLLQTERDEDFRLYNEMFLRVNLEQRKKNDAYNLNAKWDAYEFQYRYIDVYL